MPTIDNWRALREALDAGPTDKPWSLEPVEDRSIKHLCPVDADGLSILTVVTHDDTPFAAVYLDADAHYIVAAHPAAIRSLLDERDRLAAEQHVMRQWIAEVLPVLDTICAESLEESNLLAALRESGRRLVDGGPDDLLAGVE